MASIGLRASTTEIFYVVVKGSCVEPDLLVNSKLKRPKALDMPAVLAWYRDNVSALFKEFSVNSCGIKMAEPISRSMGAYQGSITRANIEGVLMETAHRSGIKIVAGPLATISPLIDSKNPKHYLQADEFRGIEGWNKLNRYYKEATLAGLAALCIARRE